MANPPKPTRTENFNHVDELLDLMSNEHRRRVLYYLRENDGIATVTELATYLSEQSAANHDALDIYLHHSILPSMDNFGVLDYDSNRDHVLYRGGSITTELIDWIKDREWSAP